MKWCDKVAFEFNISHQPHLNMVGFYVLKRFKKN